MLYTKSVLLQTKSVIIILCIYQHRICLVGTRSVLIRCKIVIEVRDTVCNQYIESALIATKFVTVKLESGYGYIGGAVYRICLNNGKNGNLESGQGGQNLYWHTKSVLKWFISSLNTVKQEMGQGFRYKICVQLTEAVPYNANSVSKKKLPVM